MTTCDFTKNDTPKFIFCSKKGTPKNGTSRACICGSYPPRAPGVLTYFSVRRRVTEQVPQGIIFRIPPPGQDIIFVKLVSMTEGPYLSFLTPQGRFRPLAHCKCDSNRLDIFTFFDRFFINSSAGHNFV